MCRGIASRVCWMLVLLLVSTPGEAVDFTKLQKRLEPHYRTYRPGSDGPFPAVMMVSGCSGFTPSVAPTSYMRVAEQLKEQGFLVIFVDYLSSRRLARCADDRGFRLSTEEVAQDILASASYLRTLPYVKGSDIVAIGWSYGGGGVLDALYAMQTIESPLFRAAVAFYPYCRGIRPWKVQIPVLLLLGALDDVAPPDVCQDVAKRVQAGTPVEVRIYPEARHGFDAPELPAVTNYGRGTIGYNATAAAAAWEEVLKFLNR